MNELVLKNMPDDCLFPFSAMRSVLDIRVGILTLREKWAYYAGLSVRSSDSGDIPANTLLSAAASVNGGNNDAGDYYRETINYPWQLMQLTDRAIRNDFALLATLKKSQPVASTNRVISPENILIEEGARVDHALLNASTGPIYISANAEIMEGAMIRGPFFLGENSVVKMGAKIYGATSVGKKCIVGGEIKNSVFFDFSNKAHDGYLGDAVIGSWCNLGAGCSCSNIKNTATDINVWFQPANKTVNAGNKCGLLLGDYSRAAINTSFNTGTITGICCNIFGEGLTPKYIPSFSWGYSSSSKYAFEKAISDITNWKKLKNEPLSTDEIQKLKHIFENS